LTQVTRAQRVRLALDLAQPSAACTEPLAPKRDGIRPVFCRLDSHLAAYDHPEDHREESIMKKTFILLALAAGAAQAGSYAVVQDSDCPLVSAKQLSGAIQKAGSATNLDLPRGMQLRTELRCEPTRKHAGRMNYVYTFTAAIEKQVADGDGQRWAEVAHVTGYGNTTVRDKLLREVRFTVRDVVRQEP
jgi:hypothetical protein